MDKFLVNFNIVIWWIGDIRRSSLRTPEENISKTRNQFLKSSHTVQHCSLCNHLLDMVFSLREDEENIRDATLNDFC